MSTDTRKAYEIADDCLNHKLAMFKKHLQNFRLRTDLILSDCHLDSYDFIQMSNEMCHLHDYLSLIKDYYFSVNEIALLVAESEEEKNAEEEQK